MEKMRAPLRKMTSFRHFVTPRYQSAYTYVETMFRLLIVWADTPYVQTKRADSFAYSELHMSSGKITFGETSTNNFDIGKVCQIGKTTRVYISNFPSR